jgi:aspartokinase/homoserine dehydrogenase 1
MEGMSLLRERTPQGLDYALGFGERLSAFVLTNLLCARGVDSVYVDARSWVRTNTHFGNAKVDWEETRRNVGTLWQSWGDRVSIHTGFIGSTYDGRTTTLGRNGSDYTATLLGSSLRAKEVIINTDVAGVMTADPRIVADAVPVSNLTFAEALELAVYGSQLFHPRTFFPLMETGVPMLIRNTLGICGADGGASGGGTLISRNGGERHNQSTAARPTCVTSLERLAMIEVVVLHQQAAADAKLGSLMSKTLADDNVTVYMESQAAHGHSIVFVIPQKEADATLNALNKSLRNYVEQGEVAAPVVTTNVTMLSVVLESMRLNPDVAARLCSTLASLGIHLLANTLGQRSYTCVIAGKDTKRAVRGVHATFNLSVQVCSVFVVGAAQCKFGSSTTATSLVRVVADEEERLRTEMQLHLRLVGVVVDPALVVPHRSEEIGSLGGGPGGEDPTEEVVLSDRGLDPARAVELLSQEIAASSSLDVMVERLKEMQNPILVDCSGSRCHHELYERCLAAGINVVVGNALSVCSLQHSSPLLSQKNMGRGALLCYDTTVGGSLPVLSCIRSLQRSGDRVLSMQCALSGSVNSIASMISEGKSLSESVTHAMESKYMELDPRVDLLGLDFARKLVMLSREVGFDLSVEDVEIVPFIGEDVLGRAVPHRALPMSNGEIETLTKSLRNHDIQYDEYLKKNGCALGENSRLCYVGTLSFNYKERRVKAKLEPTSVDEESAMNRLRGKEVFVALTTSLMNGSPLILSGAGQGGRSGATGLLSDVIQVAQRLRGRA